MSKTIEELKKYVPYNDQEKEDLELFIESEKFGEVLTRNNKLCHLCSSAFVINPTKTKVLCIYHNIYDSWGWVGGHADGDDDMIYVAQKELREETSLQNFSLLSSSPISLDTLPVHSHYKKDKYVNAHIHLSVAYLFEAEENQFIKNQEEENSSVGWLTFDELLSKCTEPHMKKVYSKIIERIKNNKY